MIVSYKESIEIDPDRRYDIFALAGKIEVYQNGMRLRDCVKAIMARIGTDWVGQLEVTYPIHQFAAPKKRKPRVRKEVA